MPDEESIENAREFAKLTGQLTAEAVVVFYNELKKQGLIYDLATSMEERRQVAVPILSAFIRTLNGGGK